MEQQPTPKTKMLKANLNKDFEINSDESHLIHFYSTDYSTPKPSDQTLDWKPPRRLHKYLHANFLAAFKNVYLNDSRWTSDEVNTVDKLYNILKDMNLETVRDRCFTDLQKANTREGKLRLENNFLHTFKTLTANGNIFMTVRIEDIIHIPKEA